LKTDVFISNPKPKDYNVKPEIANRPGELFKVLRLTHF